MIQNDFTIHIRRAESGDEACLAHVQTESWKAAFAGIVPADLLTQCTSIERAEKMYARLLTERRGNGYILELDGKPHCVAWWDAAREEDMPGAAELRCIHSLPENWRRGCGSRMMERVLADVKAAERQVAALPKCRRWYYKEKQGKARSARGRAQLAGISSKGGAYRP